MNEELVRIADIAVGENWIEDPKLMLFCILTNVAAKDSRRTRASFKSECNNEISPSYVEAVKLLYKVAGISNAPELKHQGYDMAAERICDACLQYLGGVLSPAELANFKAATPTRKFVSIMEEIFQMIKQHKES